MKNIKTNSCCPVCKKIISAEKIIDGNFVYLQKICSKHGEFKVLISKDTKRFFDKTFSSEGKSRYVNQTESDQGCPNDCGLCPNHKQHLCTALIEITGKCNLACPVCYFGDFEQADINLDEFKNRLNVVLKTENGHLDILQLSGGEPTLHAEFIEILEYAYQQDINRVVINTNGLIFFKDNHIHDKIKKLKDKVEIYLQFDGFNEKVSHKLRGKNLVKEKQHIIEKLDRDNIKICLAVTVLEENLSEIGAIIDFACKTKNITGITFQRFSRTGIGEKAEYNSVLQEDILQAISATKYLKYKDIVPLPCSHENCTSLAFLFIADNKIYSLADFVDYKKHQHIVKDKIGFESNVLEYLKTNVTCCDSSNCCSWITNKLPVVKKMIEFTEGKAATYKNMKMLRLVVKNFMDAYTFDSERAAKCCVGVSVGGNKIVPFCVNNIFRNC